MGGPLSPAKSGLVYRKRERQFFSGPHTWQLWKIQRLFGRGFALRRFIFAVRIADDDIMCSGVFCPECPSEKLNAVCTHLWCTRVRSTAGA